MNDIVTAYKDVCGVFVQTRKHHQQQEADSPRAQQAALLFRLSGNLECSQFQEKLLHRAGQAGVPEDKVTRFFVD